MAGINLGGVASEHVDHRFEGLVLLAVIEGLQALREFWPQCKVWGEAVTRPIFGAETINPRQRYFVARPFISAQRGLGETGPIGVVQRAGERIVLGVPKHFLGFAELVARELKLLKCRV